jgi:hypothetical protein
MASLTSCLGAAGELLGVEARTAIARAADKLRKDGADHGTAAKQAVTDYLKERSGALAEVETAFKDGVTLYETVPETPAAKAEAEAAVSRVDQVVRDMPDLMVQMDGMDAPMKAADFLAMVKAEADELAADGPLMQIAAECALLNGT